MSGFLRNSLEHNYREQRRLAARARVRATFLRKAGNPHADDCDAVAVLYDRAAEMWRAAMESAP